MIEINRLNLEPILHNITLDIPESGITGIVGPNGSGKTTLLRCIFKALKPTGGTIKIDGAPVRSMRSRELARKVSVVAQDSAEPPLMTVAELVSLGVAGCPDAAKDQKPHITRALKDVGMLEAAKTLVPHLSGGERQRTMIARALAQDTKYLLLDEPTNHLDIFYQLELFELLRRRQHSTVAVIHDLNLALTHCQHVHLLHHGRLISSGPATKVLVPEVLEPIYNVAVSRTKDHLRFERKTP